MQHIITTCGHATPEGSWVNPRFLGAVCEVIPRCVRPLTALVTVVGEENALQLEVPWRWLTPR
jgi:hypothetical protein